MMRSRSQRSALSARLPDQPRPLLKLEDLVDHGREICGRVTEILNHDF